MSHHCSEAGSVPSSIVPSSIGKVGPLMAADEMHQLNNETKRHRDRGESVCACVRDQRAALFHTQSRTTTYHVRWEEVFENDDIGESGGETGGRAAFKAQAAPKAKLSPEHMEVGPTKFGGRFPRKY